jgi:exopolysaccharide biosynthesis polyprenyl glycosylphosphotransferase
MAFLEAALITLFAYSEGLCSGYLNLERQARTLGKAILYATVILCIAYLLQGASTLFITAICAAGALNFGALLSWRWDVWRRRHRTGVRGQDVRNVLIIGAGVIGQRIASLIGEHPEVGRVVCGFLDDEKPLSNRVIGRVSDLALLARRGFVDEVILAGPQDWRLRLRALHEAEQLNLDVEIVPDLCGYKPAVNQVEQVEELLVISLHEESLPVVALLLKRVVDVLVSAVALLLLTPILALIAGLIRLDSPGPVIYAALRAGRKGRLFRCCKFRTMVADADASKPTLREHNERSGPFFKMANDPRITRVGRFLRRYSIDELPQLWNVLRGEMSLVGPRPHPLDDFAAYQIEHLARLDVTPGITGLWQVTARGDPSFEKGVELDREYIRKWSLGLDLRILLQTLSTVVRGSGV